MQFLGAVQRSLSARWSPCGARLPELKGRPMISPRTLTAALLGSALVGAGAGAGIYASTGGHGRTVTVAAPAAASASQVAQTTSTQPVSQIYRKAGDGVVEITASSSGGSSSPFPGGAGS